jgi:hypothetical protein
VRAGGETLPADHVVMATGVRPAVALAEAAGLELGSSGALRVDDHQRCPGHDGVFAAGDCAESWHRILRAPVNVQLGTHANKQGRIAGTNAAGGDLAFPGVIGTAVTRLCRYEVGRTGISEREAREAGIEVVAATIKDRTRAGYFPGAGPIWVKLVCEPRGGRLLGGQIVGVEGAAKRIDVLATCVWAGLDVAEIELLTWAMLRRSPASTTRCWSPRGRRSRRWRSGAPRARVRRDKGAGSRRRWSWHGQGSGDGPTGRSPPHPYRDGSCVPLSLTRSPCTAPMPMSSAWRRTTTPPT